MLLARAKEDQHLVGLPGNPLAAVSGLLTLAEPLLRTLAGRAAPRSRTRAPRGRPCTGIPYDTRLVPVVLRGEQRRAAALQRPGHAARHRGRRRPGRRTAGRGPARQEVGILDLPWASAAGIGVCFT